MENIINAKELVFTYSGEKAAALNGVTVKVEKVTEVANKDTAPLMYTVIE